MKYPVYGEACGQEVKLHVVEHESLLFLVEVAGRHCPTLLSELDAQNPHFELATQSKL